MFPSIPKVPMLGGKLAAKKKVEFANGTAEIENRRTRSNGNGTSKHDYRIQQLMHGGPVQRALHADLLLLKSEFEKDLDEAHVDSGVNANVNVSANNGGSQGSMREYSPGTIFKVFKSTFQRAKFAIVHTRCCPPRCDTEAYIQLIYSTVLELLRDVFYGYDFDGDGDGDREIYNYDFQLRATFVIFVLYTLYETNPLDEIPIEDAQGQPRKPKMQLDDEKSTHNLLSALPMGLCAEQGGRKAHRRSYRSHIRIDQIDFSLIHKLRDLALLWMDNCAQKDLCSGGDSISSDGNEQESPSNSGLRSGIIFGLAIDCIHVIDRMNPSLQLCEYSGPASLEGLTGSTTYYHAVALKELVEPFSSYDTAEASQILRAACENVSNDTGEGGDDLVGKLEMISFETSMQACHSRYNDILGKVAAALALNKNGQTPSNQLIAIQKVLAPTLDRRQIERKYGTLSERLSTALSGPLLGRSPISRGEEASEDGLVTPLIGIDQNLNEIGSQTSKAIPVSFPVSFSNGLKLGIENALLNVLAVNKKSVIRQGKMEKRPVGNIAGRTAFNYGEDSWFFDDMFEDDEGGSVEVDQERQQADEFSVVEEEQLKGFGALRQLLSFAKQKNKKQQEMILCGKGLGKDNTTWSDASIENESDYSSETSDLGKGSGSMENLSASVATEKSKKRNRPKSKIDDCISVQSILSASTLIGSSSTGPGQNALNALLSAAQPSAKKSKVDYAKKSPGTEISKKFASVTTEKSKKRNRLESKVDDNISVQSIQNASTFVSAAGPGRNALEALLSAAQPSAKIVKSNHARKSPGGDIFKENKLKSRRSKGRKPAKASKDTRLEEKVTAAKSDSDEISVESLDTMSAFSKSGIELGQSSLKLLLSKATKKSSK